MSRPSVSSVNPLELNPYRGGCGTEVEQSSWASSVRQSVYNTCVQLSRLACAVAAAHPAPEAVEWAEPVHDQAGARVWRFGSMPEG